MDRLTYNNLLDFLSSIISSYDTPKDIQKKVSTWSSSVSTYARDNPIFSVKKRINDDGGEIDVNIPYFGSISLDVFLFSSSAILSRVYIFWRSRRRRQRQVSIEEDDDDDDKIERSDKPQRDAYKSPPVKATVVRGYKDEGLYETINRMQDVRKSLRKVVDPEVTRKEKQERLKQQNIVRSISGQNSGSCTSSCSDGYLGMSSNSLQEARKILKKVDVEPADHTMPKRAMV